MGRATLITGVIVGVFLVVSYTVIAREESPRWLAGIETASGVFEATVTGLALIFGGLFAYYKFFKEETYSERLQVGIEASAELAGGVLYVNAVVSAENKGRVSVEIDLSETRIVAYVRDASDGSWEPASADSIFGNSSILQPGEVSVDQAWLELPYNEEKVIRLAAAVSRKNATDEVSGWVATDMVSLLDIRDKIPDTPSDED